jgi:5-hydroxyisourate hydrolase
MDRELVTTGLTTHVLDTARGRPAAGVAVTLRGPAGVLVETRTNADGRTDAPLVAELVDGTYELTYAVGRYFADFESSTERGQDEAPYLDLIPVRVNLIAAMGHVHVALLVTPWSYTTYRGS